jgi:hypothetical protein
MDDKFLRNKVRIAQYTAGWHAKPRARGANLACGLLHAIRAALTVVTGPEATKHSILFANGDVDFSIAAAQGHMVTGVSRLPNSDHLNCFTSRRGHLLVAPCVGWGFQLSHGELLVASSWLQSVGVTPKELANPRLRFLPSETDLFGPAC